MNISSSIVKWSVSPPVTRETGVQFPVGERVLQAADTNQAAHISNLQSKLLFALRTTNKSALQFGTKNILFTWISSVITKTACQQIFEFDFEKYFIFYTYFDTTFSSCFKCET